MNIWNKLVFKTSKYSYNTLLYGEINDYELIICTLITKRTVVPYLDLMSSKFN